MIGFSRVNLAELKRFLSFGPFSKDFFLLLKKGTKDILYHQRDEVTNGRRTVVPSRAVSGVGDVSGLINRPITVSYARSYNYCCN